MPDLISTPLERRKRKYMRLTSPTPPPFSQRPARDRRPGKVFPYKRMENLGTRSQLLARRISNYNYVNEIAM